MSNSIIVEPVTRVEGHGKINIIKDSQDKITGARLQVVEFRGFEKFCQGALAELMPQLTARICGICPIVHHLASVKAIEHAFGVTIPPTATKLRRLHIMGQFIESHALSLAVLSLPDLLFLDSAPAERNVVHLQAKEPALVKTALGIREAGTAINKIVGRREVNPIGSRAGGVVVPFSEDERKSLQPIVQAALKEAIGLGATLHSVLQQRMSVIEKLGNVKTNFMGMISDDGYMDFYDGNLAIIDANGNQTHKFPNTEYFDYFKEVTENWSYMKFPELKSGGHVRVAPLARVQVAGKMRFEGAAQELEWLKSNVGLPAHASLLNHAARYIELLEALGWADKLLQDPELTNKEVCIPVQPKQGTGVGIVEAPRGTLVHQYTFGADGRVEKANLIVATAHNNRAINEALSTTAVESMGSEPSEAELNRLEMICRAYDPCLSCATHSQGKRPFVIEMIDEAGTVLKSYS